MLLEARQVPVRGILAHAYEQSQRRERNKGPMRRSSLWAYDGPPARLMGGGAAARDSES